MIDRQDSCTTYEVQYKTKYGKRMQRAYTGDNKHVFDQVVKDLEARSDIRYLAKTVSQTEVTLY
jgi:hypothetical protein